MNIIQAKLDQSPIIPSLLCPSFNRLQLPSALNRTSRARASISSGCFLVLVVSGRT